MKRLLRVSTINTAWIVYFTATRCFSRGFTSNIFYGRAASIQHQQLLGRKGASMFYAEPSTSKVIRSSNITNGNELSSGESRVSNTGGFARFTGPPLQPDEEKSISNYLDYS